MKRKDIINAIQTISDYEVEETEVTKNGVELQGIIFKLGNICPVIYTDNIISKATEQRLSAFDVATKIIQQIESDIHNIDISVFTDPEYIKNHVKIGIQRKTAENIIKAPSGFEGIEKYLYIISNDNQMSAKLTYQLLEDAGLNAKEIWKSAEKNTFSDTQISSLSEVLFSRFGMPLLPEEECIPLYIVTNKSGIKGAANILDKKALRAFGKTHGIKEIYILPSSIHEVLIYPVSAETDIKALSEMVSAINGSEVDPVEQLADRALIMTL